MNEGRERASEPDRVAGAGRVIVAGSSGLIGSALVDSLVGDGYEVVRLVRRPARDGAVGTVSGGGEDACGGEDAGTIGPIVTGRIREHEWHPGERPLDPAVLEGALAVVNLCGASIGKLPWTPAYRKELRSSRIEPTRALATALRELGERAPGAAVLPVFLSASAVGIYGDRPGGVLSEHSAPGEGFLAELCTEWEAQALAAGPRVRVALLRTASVLHPRAVLKPLIPLTRFCLSGPLGGGRQIWPWISLTDEVRGIRHVLTRVCDGSLTGPVNLCGPEAASANEIGRELARMLGRPFLLPAPAFALRLALGRTAADSLLLATARVEPRALLDTGFAFRTPTAQAALAAAL